MASQRASYQKFTSQCSEDTVTSEGWVSSFFYSSSKDTAVNETRSSECNVLRSSACSLCICCKGCPCDVSYGAAGFMVVGATVALVVVASVAKIARKKARPSSVHVPLSSPPQLSPAVVSEPQSSRRATPVPQSKNQGQLETARNKFSGEDEVKFKLLSSVQQLENNGIISKQEAERQRASIQRKFSVPSAPMTSFWALCWYSAAAFAILATALTLLEKPGILRTLLLTPMTLLFRVDALAKACLLLVAAAALAWNAPKAPAHLDGLVDFLTAGFLAAALGAWNLLVLDTGRWENETAQGDAGSLLWWRWTVGLTAVALGGLAGALRSECFFQLAFHAAAAWAALMAALAGQCESWGGLGALERLAACFAAQAVAWRALARFHAAPEEAPARRRSFVDEVKELEKKEGGSPGALARLWARGGALGAAARAAARQLAGWGAKGSSLAATYALIFLWVAAGPLISHAAQPRGEADTICSTRAPILSYLATCLCVVGTAVYAARWHSISAWNFFLYGSTVLFVLHTWPVLADVPESVDLDYWLGMNLPVRLSVLTGSVLFLSVEGGVGGPLWAALGRLASVSRTGAGAGTPLKDSPNALVKRAQASSQNPNWQGQTCPRPGPSSAPPPLAPPDFRAATRLWASRWLLVALWCVQLQGNYGLRAWREGALDLESRGGPRYAGRARLLGWGLPLLAAAGGFLLSGARAALRAEAAAGGGGGVGGGGEEAAAAATAGAGAAAAAAGAGDSLLGAAALAAAAATACGLHLLRVATWSEWCLALAAAAAALPALTRRAAAFARRAAAAQERRRRGSGGGGGDSPPPTPRPLHPTPARAMVAAGAGEGRAVKGSSGLRGWLGSVPGQELASGKTGSRKPSSRKPSVAATFPGTKMPEPGEEKKVGPGQTALEEETFEVIPLQGSLISSAQPDETLPRRTDRKDPLFSVNM